VSALSPEALVEMLMPFIHPERRLSMRAPLNTYEDELPAVVSLVISPPMPRSVAKRGLEGPAAYWQFIRGLSRRLRVAF
jgi:hypothetical protein